MLETNIILVGLGCKKNIIYKINEIEKKKVINLDPYNSNNSNTYINNKINKKTFQLPNFLKSLEQQRDYFILNVENIYECVLALFDDEYYKEEEKINKKYSNFFRIKLLTDLDEKFSDLKNKKKIREMLDNRMTVMDDIFYYFKEFFCVSIYVIKESNKSIKKYINSENQNYVLIIQIENQYYPIIGKEDNNNVRIFNDSLMIDELDIFKKASKFSEVSSEINYNILLLADVQKKAQELNIHIMKLNKKGDKEIKKTKKDLITEINLHN